MQNNVADPSTQNQNIDILWKYSAIFITVLIGIVGIVVGLIVLKVFTADRSNVSSASQVDALFSKDFYELKRHSEKIKEQLNGYLPLGVPVE